MTRKLSLTTAVAVAALSVGAPAALGQDRHPVSQTPVLTQPDPMIEDGFARAVARQQSIWMAEDGFDRAVAAAKALQAKGTFDSHERSSATNPIPGEPQWLKALNARSEGLNKLYGLGEYAAKPTFDTHERSSATNPVPTESQSLKALNARSEGLNKLYGLGEYSTSVRYSDSVDGAVVAGNTEASVVSATSSGTEIEWPQVGVGFGIGILLVLGLGLIMRAVHIRPFAH